MSYNIDNWRTKKLNNFAIELKSIFNDDLDVSMADKDTVFINGMCEMFEISGKIENDFVIVEKIDFGGVGSGHSWNSFKDLLKSSKGEMIATQVWEGGDSITKLTVIDGIITEENVEI